MMEGIEYNSSPVTGENPPPMFGIMVAVGISLLFWALLAIVLL
ncbi:hypothetical protein [Stakelama tenebrarum]|nr:hypothetical protein [Sphingosinithalassobacter tenebrarum]